MFNQEKNFKDGKRVKTILRYPAMDILCGPADPLLEDCARNRCFWRCTG